MPPSLAVYAAVARRARGAPLLAAYPAKLRAAALLGAAAGPAAAAAYAVGAAALGHAPTAAGATGAAALGALAGGGAAAWLTGALLAPVRLAAGALRDYLVHDLRPAFPADLPEDDEAGALLADTRQALERLDEAVVHAATVDRRSGLPGRALFRDQVRHATAQARRDGRPVGVLVLEVEGLQPVSAALGPAAGGTVLGAVAGRLRAVLRETDVLAQLDGHEFAVLSPGGTTVEGMDALARRVLEAVRRPVAVAGRDVRVGASAGVALFPADASGVDQLLGNAAAALYDAQQAAGPGAGGGHRFYSAALNAGLQERMALEDDLRHALDRGELELHYQPKVRAADARVLGFEALLRWRHPERGLVPPVEFIPVAEATGLIVPIGTWVLQAACAQLAAWRRAGLPAVHVAVNLSARQFRHGDLAATVRAALAESGADPASLELEVTESLLMDDTRHTVAVLHALRAAGVAISLDDFGTGYSSLGYLKRFPLDAIKLDKSFVRDAVGDAQSSAITTAIIALGHSLGLTVVAEGVETEAQRAWLCEQGCDVLQGYLFGRPVPADEAGRVLALAAVTPAAADGAPTLVLVA
jgi:diguanylate cyclase (GGDEF)-like protein